MKASQARRSLRVVHTPMTNACVRPETVRGRAGVGTGVVTGENVVKGRLRYGGLQAMAMASAMGLGGSEVRISVVQGVWITEVRHA